MLYASQWRKSHIAFQCQFPIACFFFLPGLFAARTSEGVEVAFLKSQRQRDHLVHRSPPQIGQLDRKNLNFVEVDVRNSFFFFCIASSQKNSKTILFKGFDL